jgi:hypothetical protein
MEVEAGKIIRKIFGEPIGRNWKPEALAGIAFAK